jgi:hypothetical protein
MSQVRASRQEQRRSFQRPRQPSTPAGAHTDRDQARERPGCDKTARYVAKLPVAASTIVSVASTGDYRRL